MKHGRVLIVDDSTYARRIIRQTLETEGHTVVEANSGLAAIESYYLQRPDVVLLDLTMEDMGGVEVLEKLRSIDATAKVIVISADVQSSTESVVKSAGALQFLGKPAPAARILEAVADALQDGTGS